MRSAWLCLLVSFACAGCAERPVDRPELIDGSYAEVADGAPSASPPTPFAFAAYDREAQVGGLDGCGAILAFSDRSLASCHAGTLTTELSGRSLSVHLNSDSDKGSYGLSPGWTCHPGPSGLVSDATYTDEEGRIYEAVDGSVEISSIGSGIVPLLGSYHLVVQEPGGDTLQLDGSFSAPPCGP